MVDDEEVELVKGDENDDLEDDKDDDLEDDEEVEVVKADEEWLIISTDVPIDVVYLSSTVVLLGVNVVSLAVT